MAQLKQGKIASEECKCK